MTMPFSQACENNKHPILTVLSRVFSNQKHVLEVGSGSGQHAVYFAKNLPQLTWQTSDLVTNHNGINQWIDAHPSPNIKRPISLDLEITENTQVISKNTDAIFTANTLHIISWPLVQNFFKLVAQQLSQQGMLCIYGPFKYQGKFTSESNANFELWLKERDERSGIRHFEDICQLADQVGLSLVEDIAMPANNQLLVFKKRSPIE